MKVGPIALDQTDYELELGILNVRSIVLLSFMYL